MYREAFIATSKFGENYNTNLQSINLNRKLRKSEMYFPAINNTLGCVSYFYQFHQSTSQAVILNLIVTI
jgi:hypothetical protein